MKKVIKLILVCSVLFLLFSCDRSEIGVNTVQSQAYVTTKGQMGFSFYVNGDFSSDDGNSVIIESPFSTYTWNSKLSKYSYDGVVYYGSSDFVMPVSALLIDGIYKYTIVCKDGRTIEGNFDIQYGDINQTLERAKDKVPPYYDEISNLTVIN